MNETDYGSNMDPDAGSLMDDTLIQPVHVECSLQTNPSVHLIDFNNDAFLDDDLNDMDMCKDYENFENEKQQPQYIDENEDELTIEDYDDND